VGRLWGPQCHFQKSISFWVRSGLHRVRSGLHWASSGADTRFQSGHLLLRSRCDAGGRAGAVRLSAGVVILVQVFGTHTGRGGCVALRVGGLGAVGLGNTGRSDEYAQVLPGCHGTVRLCDKAGRYWARPPFLSLITSRFLCPAKGHAPAHVTAAGTESPASPEPQEVPQRAGSVTGFGPIRPLVKSGPDPN
jgi:hypothetical protein